MDQVQHSDRALVPIKDVFPPARAGAPRLQRILDGELCSGCGLCASLFGPARARMDYNEDGFQRPVLTGPATEEEDELIAQVCPGNRLEQIDADRPTYGVWGPIVSLHTGFATDETLRFRASSGGALSAIVDYLVGSGAADYALHIGADDQVPWLNRLGESHDHQAILDRAGSRYAPSAPLANLIQRLDEPGRFVVVGKPCDIAGLRQYARIDPRVDEKVVAMLAFMCGGVPSRRGIELLLRKLGARAQEVIAFRYRGNGWPGRVVAQERDGTVTSLSYEESWGSVLSSHVQHRCKICPDGDGQFADIVCADAWYGDARGYPVFEEQDGRSLVMARTRKGADLVTAAATAQKLALAPLAIGELDVMQPYQAKRTRVIGARLAGLKLMGQPIPTFKGFHLLRAARQAGLLLNLRNSLGIMRRSIQKRWRKRRTA